LATIGVTPYAEIVWRYAVIGIEPPVTFEEVDAAIRLILAKNAGAYLLVDAQQRRLAAIRLGVQR
jgi:hypothetical protein